jgi:PPOX class probable F420-dependent enzyme
LAPIVAPMSQAGWVNDRLGAARVARLATADANGTPRVVPVTFALVEDRIVTVVDGKATSNLRLKRLANIAVNPKVSLLVDHYDDGDWSALWWVRVDGRAHIARDDRYFDAGVRASRVKYPQYRDGVRTDGPLIVIDVERVSSWSTR